MDNFDYIKYLKEGKLFEESVNESLTNPKLTKKVEKLDNFLKNTNNKEAKSEWDEIRERIMSQYNDDYEWEAMGKGDLEKAIENAEEIIDHYDIWLDLFNLKEGKLFESQFKNMTPVQSTGGSMSHKTTTKAQDSYVKGDVVEIQYGLTSKSGIVRDIVDGRYKIQIKQTGDSKDEYTGEKVERDIDNIRGVHRESVNEEYKVNAQEAEDNFKNQNTQGVYLVKALNSEEDFDPLNHETEWISFSPGLSKQLGVGRMKRYMEENPSDGSFTYYIATIFKGGKSYQTTGYPNGPVNESTSNRVKNRQGNIVTMEDGRKYRMLTTKPSLKKPDFYIDTTLSQEYWKVYQIDPNDSYMLDLRGRVKVIPISDPVNESLEIAGKEVEKINKIGDNTEDWTIMYKDGSEEPYLNHIRGTIREALKHYIGAWGKEEHEEKREKIDRSDAIRYIKLALDRLEEKGLLEKSKLKKFRAIFDRKDPNYNSTIVDLIDTKHLNDLLVTMLEKERGDTNEGKIQEIKSISTDFNPYKTTAGKPSRGGWTGD